MPNVTAPARTMNNGETITYFTDTVGTTAVTWTYPNEQEGLVVTNKGNTNLTLTVNSTNYTIIPGGVQTVSAVFTSFTIQSAGGTQQFDAQAWSFQKDTVIAQLSGRKVEQIKVHDGVSVPAGAYLPSSTWLSTEGWDEIAITSFKAGSTSNGLEIHWSHDGSAQHAVENITTSAVPTKAGQFSVKANYFRLSLYNGDTAAQTMHSWARKKA